jgi:hypothetical protein
MILIFLLFQLLRSSPPNPFGIKAFQLLEQFHYFGAIAAILEHFNFETICSALTAKVNLIRAVLALALWA